jgi:hypothetical protein
MHKRPHAQVGNAPAQWTTMVLVFRLHSSVSSRIWIRMHQSDCNPVQHTIRHRRKARRQLATLVDDEDKVELFTRIKTETLSARWKTGRWRKVGLAAAKEALKGGQEATTSDDWGDHATYSYHDYRWIILEMGHSRHSLHRWTRFSGEAVLMMFGIEYHTVSGHAEPTASAETATLQHAAVSACSAQSALNDSSCELQGKQSFYATSPRERCKTFRPPSICHE